MYNKCRASKNVLVMGLTKRIVGNSQFASKGIQNLDLSSLTLDGLMFFVLSLVLHLDQGLLHLDCGTWPHSQSQSQSVSWRKSRTPR